MREPIRVIEPQAVKESLRVSKTAKPIWIAVVATLLWGINGLKVQSVVHELIVTIAISQHRIDSLLALEGKCIPNTKTHLVRCSTSSQSVLDSELRTVQVRLRSTSRRELNRIEQALEIATQPTFLSQEYENMSRGPIQSKFCAPIMTESWPDRMSQQTNRSIDLWGSKTLNLRGLPSWKKKWQHTVLASVSLSNHWKKPSRNRKAFCRSRAVKDNIQL